VRLSASRLLGTALLVVTLCGLGLAGPAQGPLVRIAELEIDPAQLDRYKAAVTEEIETSIRVEPGVLAIYAVAVKDDPSHLRFFEIYQDEAAYKAHRESVHFKKYVAITQPMIKSRKLIETVPLILGSKAKNLPGGS
jgi:quinol monooxygenase YgiN